MNSSRHMAWKEPGITVWCCITKPNSKRMHFSRSWCHLIMRHLKENWRANHTSWTCSCIHRFRWKRDKQRAMFHKEARSVLQTAPVSSTARKTTEGQPASQLHELDLPPHLQILSKASGHRGSFSPSCNQEIHTHAAESTYQHALSANHKHQLDT